MLTIAIERAPKRKRQERRLRIILRRIRSGFSCREEGAEGAILELQIRGRRQQPQLRNSLPWPGIARNQLAFRPVLDGMSAVGEDTGTPVNLTYDLPFKFTGTIDKVTIDLKPIAPATAQENEKRQGEAALAKALQD
jgi:hypothetical protein